MKKLLFAVLMVISVSAHAYSKGDVQLILTIVSERHTSIEMGEFFTVEACEKSGKRWLAAHGETYKTGLRDAYYICARTD